MPTLSLVLIAYEMERELPRTVLSLSSAMQVGIHAEDYEIIIVDNGSRRPLDEAGLQRIASNVRVLRMPDPTPSPAPAIHLGLEAASGDLIGVWIDGARMASPGLLKNAVAAARLHPNPVIGTFSLHLGSKTQMLSVLEGYCQSVEDELLARCDWEKDGYRLFGVSCFAGSSPHGWFSLPNETNALFLERSEWRRLGGGYDPRFVSPGGGLANLDLWRRLVNDPARGVVMLLGEGTFHQFHGGVATNALTSPWSDFADEYKAIRQEPYQAPVRTPLLYGALNQYSKLLI